MYCVPFFKVYVLQTFPENITNSSRTKQPTLKPTHYLQTHTCKLKKKKKKMDRNAESNNNKKLHPPFRTQAQIPGWSSVLLGKIIRARAVHTFCFAPMVVEIFGNANVAEPSLDKHTSLERKAENCSGKL